MRGRPWAVVALGMAAACGGDDDAGSDLAERVRAVLEADGNRDVRGAEVTCPSVTDPTTGDRATCVLRTTDDREVEVDIEFRDGDAIAVVAIVP